MMSDHLIRVYQTIAERLVDIVVTRRKLERDIKAEMLIAAVEEAFDRLIPTLDRLELAQLQVKRAQLIREPAA